MTTTSTEAGQAAHNPVVRATETAPVSARADASPAPLWADLTATFFHIGNIRPGPGTWAATATLLLWVAVAALLPTHSRLTVAVIAAIAATAIGIPASSRVARACGKKDPSNVVIDEVAGQLIAMIGVPLAWKPLLVSLVLFRILDITKPTPLRRLEHLPGGVGIMMDDVGAGLYALAIMHTLLHFGLLS